MTPRQVYLEAGRRLAEGRSQFSCFAIAEAKIGSHFLSHPLVTKYQEVFFPEGNSFDFCNAVEEFAGKSSGNSSSRKAHNLRVLMVTLMAACWRDFR